MPSQNCSIHGYPVSRTRKSKGIGIYKVPSGNDDFERHWREKIVDIITKDREINSKLRKIIKNRRLWVCQRHYHDNQINFHDSRSYPKPGEVPQLELLLRKKIHVCSSTSSLRQSAVNIAAKMEGHLQNGACSSTISLCYKSFVTKELKAEFINLNLHHLGILQLLLIIMFR